MALMRKSKRARNSKKSKRNNKRTTIRKRNGGFSLFKKNSVSIKDYSEKFEDYKTARGESPTVESDKILKELMSLSIDPCAGQAEYITCESSKTKLYFEFMKYLGLLNPTYSSDIEKKALEYYTAKTKSKANNLDNAKRQQSLPNQPATVGVSE